MPYCCFFLLTDLQICIANVVCRLLAANLYWHKECGCGLQFALGKNYPSVRMFLVALVCCSRSCYTRFAMFGRFVCIGLYCPALECYVEHDEWSFIVANVLLGIELH